VIDAVDVAGALPLFGGLVVAESDGAVLGQYVRHHSTPMLGEGGMCVSLYDMVRPDSGGLETVESVLSRTFPMLHVGTWSPQLLEEIFSHSSLQHYDDGRDFNVGNQPLAYVGDAAMKLAFGLRARELGIPHAHWQMYIQRTHTNPYLVGQFERMGLDRYIKVGAGASIPKGSKVKANTYEALVGAVYTAETFETFVSFCEACGFIPSDETASAVVSPGV